MKNDDIKKTAKSKKSALLKSEQIESEEQQRLEREERRLLRAKKHQAAKKRKLTLLIIASSFVALVFAVAIFFSVKLQTIDELNGISFRQYCGRINFEITPESDGNFDFIVDRDFRFIGCVSKNSFSKLRTLDLTMYQDNEAGRELFQRSYSLYTGIGIILDKTDTYTKVFFGAFDGILTYVVLTNDNKVLKITAKTEEAAKNAILDLGFPDQNWEDPDGSDLTKRNLELEYRDRERQKSLNFLAEQLLTYQTNNRGALPVGPVYWKGTINLKCEINDSLCDFVRIYLNSEDNDAINEFTDPLGLPYSLYITENWAKNGQITLNYGEAGLAETADGGYTISDSEGINGQTIYVVPGGHCNADNNLIPSISETAFALAYRLENGSVYCVDK